jgi:hypothetical protein
MVRFIALLFFWQEVHNKDPWLGLTELAGFRDGKSAFSKSEQFAFHHVLRNGRAVDA